MLTQHRADPSASQIVRNQDRRVAEDRRGAKSTWGGGGMTAKASEVAVAQTPRYDLTINLKTTEALGLIVLQAVL